MGPGRGQAEVGARELVQDLEVLGGVGDGEEADDGLPGVTGPPQVKRGRVSADLGADFVEYVDQITVEIQILV